MPFIPGQAIMLISQIRERTAISDLQSTFPGMTKGLRDAKDTNEVQVEGSWCISRRTSHLEDDGADIWWKGGLYSET